MAAVRRDRRFAMPSPYAELVAALCEEAIGRLPHGPSRAELEAIAAQLRDPLRLVVAGRVNTGKSTLINALLRRRLAPTGVTETTRATMRYGDAAPELLQGVLLVDTPGLDSAIGPEDPSPAAAAETFATADVLVFLVSHTALEDDAAALCEVQALSDGGDSSPAATVAVLGKADKVAGAPSRVRALAAELAEKLGPAVSAVVPLVALLAETAEANELTESDAGALEALAAHDVAERQTMLLAADLFRARATNVSSEDRERLLERLDLYGIAVCLDAIERGARDVAALRDELRRASGISGLLGAVTDSLELCAARQPDVALAALARTSDTADDAVAAWLRAQVERVRSESTRAAA